MTNNKPVNRFNSEMPCHGPVMFNENLSRDISVATYWHDLDFLSKKKFEFLNFEKPRRLLVQYKNDAYAHTFDVGVFTTENAKFLTEI